MVAALISWFTSPLLVLLLCLFLVPARKGVSGTLINKDVGVLRGFHTDIHSNKSIKQQQQQHTIPWKIQKKTSLLQYYLIS
jgi:hypothetical protein